MEPARACEGDHSFFGLWFVKSKNERSGGLWQRADGLGGVHARQKLERRRSGEVIAFFRGNQKKSTGSMPLLFS
jgi:hypothetical protein